MSTGRTSKGRFAPGNRANPKGRPTNEQRMRQAIERTLANAGATPEDIARLAQAAGNPMRAAEAIAVMVAAVAERKELTSGA
ncbi:hypothetical protein [Bradyrhizobium sp. LA7.1]|uniref:hypothetical protein n=1 Tax=Bradyrhizobium sp. LA7.1 TaxID=3156324 RepID=UPI0033939003